MAFEFRNDIERVGLSVFMSSKMNKVHVIAVLEKRRVALEFYVPYGEDSTSKEQLSFCPQMAAPTTFMFWYFGRRHLLLIRFAKVRVTYCSRWACFCGFLFTGNFGAGEYMVPRLHPKSLGKKLPTRQTDPSSHEGHSYWLCRRKSLFV
jgi:hypothetical protein